MDNFISFFCDINALHSFSKYLLSSYSVPSTDLDTEDSGGKAITLSYSNTKSQF